MLVVRQLEPRLVLGEPAQPVALLEQQRGAAEAQTLVVRLDGEGGIEVGQRRRPLAAPGQQVGARPQGGEQPVISRQRLVIGALGVGRTAEALEGAALVVEDGGIAWLQALGALQGVDRRGVLAELGEAAGVVDVRGGIARQELRCPLQRRARLGVAAELEADLAEKVKRQARVRPRLGDAREQRLGAGEIARIGPFTRFAAERVDLLIGESHPVRRSRRAGWRAKKKPAVDREAGSRPPARIRRWSARQGKGGPLRKGIRGSGAPERLADLELDVAGIERQVAHHAVIELGEFVAHAGAAAPGGDGPADRAESAGQRVVGRVVD
jgi:hypothetical protein